jgi:hypothetical protein
MRIKKGYYLQFVTGVSFYLFIWATVTGPRAFFFIFGTVMLASLAAAIRSDMWTRAGTVPTDPAPQRWGRWPYRPMRTNAGRWLEAPVAELDKSTIGKLLASRASRDPSLHVVVRSTPAPICSDALYDAELDG